VVQLPENCCNNGRIQRIGERDNTIQESFRDLTWRMSGIWEHKFNPNAQMNLGLLFQRLENTQDKAETNITTTQNFTNNPANTPGLIGSPTSTSINEIRNTNEQEWLATLGFNFLLGENHRLSAGFEGSFRDRDAGLVDRVDVKANYELSEQQFNFYLQDEIAIAPNHLLLRFYGRNIGGIKNDRIRTTFDQQNRFVDELVDLQSASAIYGFNLSWSF
jgi:hypothetical protein